MPESTIRQQYVKQVFFAYEDGVEMNVKSLLLEYALPGAVVIGTGLLTFALTGGQEEFPSPDDEFEEDDNMVQQVPLHYCSTNSYRVKQYL